MAKVSIRAMRISDYDGVLRIWNATEGMCLESDDSRAGIALYLARNLGLCFVATAGRSIIGTVLCGHDGRRGILRHLAVVPGHRGNGIARSLVARSLAALRAQGIGKCNLFVMRHNPSGLRFWKRLGYRKLKDDYRTLQSATDSLCS